MAIKRFCDVCGNELAEGENRSSVGWPYEVPVDPENGRPVTVVFLSVGVGIGEPGHGDVCKPCTAKAGQGAVQQFLASLQN